MILGIIILILITVVPVKIGAELFGADNKGFKFCILAAVVGTILASISASLIGGLIGLIVSYIVVSIVYSKIFQFSFGGSLGFTLAVFVIQIGVVQGLNDLGLVLVKFT